MQYMFATFYFKKCCMVCVCVFLIYRSFRLLLPVVIMAAVQQMNLKTSGWCNIADTCFWNLCAPDCNIDFSPCNSISRCSAEISTRQNKCMTGSRLCMPCRYLWFSLMCSSDLSRITRLLLDQHLTHHRVPQSPLHFHQEHHLLAQHLPPQEVSFSHRWWLLWGQELTH